MNILESIKTRKSIRHFQPTPVPKEILEEVISIASRSPSAMNIQPWEIMMVAGDVLENIKKGNLEKLTAGEPPAPEIPEPRFEGEYRRRQVELAIQLFQLMGIAREDKEKKVDWMTRGFRFFDAPAAIILLVDRSLDQLYSRFDIGSIAQTICLVAMDYGLGTCIHGQGVYYPAVIRQFAEIPDSKCMAVCISIGYPDGDFPANKLESKREPLENFVTWCGFD